MASITDFLNNYPDDWFDKLNSIQENLYKQFDGVDSLMKTIEDFSKKIDMPKLDYYSGVIKLLNDYGEKLTAFNDIESNVISNVCKLYRNDDFSQTLRNVTSFFSKVDVDIVENLSKLSSLEIIQNINSLQLAIPNIEQYTKDDNYILEEKSEKDKKTQETVKSESAEKKKLNANSVKIYLEIVCSCIAILEFFISIFFSNASEINISIGNDFSTNYYIAEVNNYYVNDCEFNAYLCNNAGFRFVAEKEIKPRIKADCSSTVVDTLKLGKLVQIVDKYNKWVQICWQNEDGTYSYGWIQNYKLSEFK